MTHRDPVSTVPSYASMESTLYGMSSSIDRESVGQFWEGRLAELLTMFMTARRNVGADRFIDVLYTELTQDPIPVGLRVLAQAGMAATPEVVAGMSEWVEANRREDRAPHRYSLEDFGLDRTRIERDFADYRSSVLNLAAPS